MKLENFYKVQLLIQQRSSLIGHISRLSDSSETGDYLGMTFLGHYQDKEIRDLVRPLLIKHLSDKRIDIEHELFELGVRL